MRVLVVEDERRLAAAIRRGLTAEGFVVDVAQDGVDGLHLAREGGYDAVVPAEDRERAFGRFSRLDEARYREGEDGAGLGLAIVRATAEAHGGSVTLGDAGPGLRATVRLPRLGTVGSGIGKAASLCN